MTSDLAATIRAVWRVHDEALLTARERMQVAPSAAAFDLLWAAHDAVERATLKLHALATPDEIAALQEAEA